MGFEKLERRVASKHKAPVGDNAILIKAARWRSPTAHEYHHGYYIYFGSNLVRKFGFKKGHCLDVALGTGDDTGKMRIATSPTGQFPVSLMGIKSWRFSMTGPTIEGRLATLEKAHFVIDNLVVSDDGTCRSVIFSLANDRPARMNGQGTPKKPDRSRPLSAGRTDHRSVGRGQGHGCDHAKHRPAPVNRPPRARLSCRER